MSGVFTVTKSKKVSALGQSSSMEDLSVSVEDRSVPEAPKMIVLASISHLPPGRFSSYSEGADRSERLRCYNINETFSSSMLLSSIRDKTAEPPAPVESTPAWKLIRPREAHVIRAEPAGNLNEKSDSNVLPCFSATQTAPAKLDRWIEIASPYINYPTASALHM